jgi:flagellar biosynthesis/type III secretory pathway M-ring protein FliF/YscJ
VPTTPEVPIAPVVPTAPEVSIAPVVPTAPEVSITPVVPTAPEVSITPVVPTAPEVSITPVVPTAPEVSTTTYAEVATTDDTTNFANNTNPTNKYPERKTANNVIMYAAIGGGIPCIVIIIIIWIIVVRWRRKRDARHQGVQYTVVRMHRRDPNSSAAEQNSFDRRFHDTPSPIYAEPHAHKQFTTFRPPENSNA